MITIFAIFVFIFIPIHVNALTIVLDAGHGGHDTGAINKNRNIYEKEVNLKIAKYLKEYLEDYKSIKIIMTRDSDKFLEIFDRAMIGRNNKADLVISLHLNSSESGNINGAEVFVTHNKSLDKYNKETTILGNKILNNLNKIGIENRGVKTRLITNDDTDIYSDGTIADYYGIIRYSMRGVKIDSGVIKPEGKLPAKIENGEGIPAIIIEHCFINSTDSKYIDSDSKIHELAKADADAIVEYYNLKRKNNFKLNQEMMIIQPDTTIQEIQEVYKTAQMVGAISEMATGARIKIEDKEYKVVKLGDCNGDGNITPADYVKIKNNIMKVNTLTGENKKAADVNEDGKITPADYVKVKNHIMNVSKIQIKMEG